jgi:peptide/nickel transport system permease protein
MSTLTIAAATTLLVVVIGATLGMIAGYAGGRIDLVMMRVVELAFALPPLVLAIAVVAFVGGGTTNVIIALTIVYVPLMARVARASALSVRRLPFIQAARAVGESDPQIVIRQVAPNIAPAIMVQATLIFAFAILAEASLSFLGLGTQEPRPSWGRLLQDAIPLVSSAPWVGIFPGVFIALVVLGVASASDGLRDVLDVTNRRTRGGDE